jgi:hypothetical protein
MSRSDLTQQTPRATPLPPGTGRIGVVRAYFDIFAVLGGAVTGGLLVSTIWPSLIGPVTLPAHPWVSIGGAALCSWGSFQTSLMLRDRLRVGAWAASLTFAASLVATGPQALSLPAVGLSVLGLGLLASVWRYLE